MRRADTGHMPELSDPRFVVLARVVRRASRHQAAHAVTNERDLFDRDRVGFERLGDQLGECAPVLGDVAAGVVAKIDRRVTEVVREARAEGHVRIAVVFLGGEAPEPFGRSEAVDENADLVGRVRKRSGKGFRGRGKVPPVVAKRHAQIEAVVLSVEVVPPKTVDRGLDVVDVPGRSTGRARSDWRGELESIGVGRLGKACFGHIGDGVHREAADAVEHANRLEYATRNRGLDARDDLRRTLGRLDGRKTSHGSLDDRIMGAFDQIGRFRDQVEHQIHKTSYPPHALGAPWALPEPVSRT